MTVRTVIVQLASANDEGRIKSDNVTASNEEEPLAGTGTLTLLSDTTTDQFGGMETPFGTRRLYQTWLRFDLSSVRDNVKLISANLLLDIQGGGGSNKVYEGYSHDWTQPLTTGQWKDPRDFVAATPIISQNDLSISAGSNRRLAFTAAGLTTLESAINGTGIVEFLVTPQEAVDNTWPPGNYSIAADRFEDGASTAPRLEVTYDLAPGGFLYGANF